MAAPQRMQRSVNGGRYRQGGAMTVMLLLLMLGLVSMLGLVEVGYLYWARRDTQNVADLAALAGAQRLDLCGDGGNAAARASASQDNAFIGTLIIQCGQWSPANPGADHFSAGAQPDQINAVKVVARRTALPFFGQNASLPQVSASAVAQRSAPLVAFSVGSQLARVNGHTPLGNLLSLIGVDLDGTTLAGYEGLAQVTVTPKGLLQALGIPVAADISAADLNALLNANQVSLGQLLDASVKLISQSGAGQIDLSALRNALASQLSLQQVAIPLGTSSAGNGLIGHITTPDGSSGAAAEVALSLDQVLSTGIGIAARGHAATVDGLNLLGLVKAQASVIEPPSLGLGGVGATAYTAQVRLKLDIDTSQLPLGSLLSSLMRLHVTTYADVVNAKATVTEVHCESEPHYARFKVDANVLQVCAGNTDTPWNATQELCTSHLQNQQMLSVAGLSTLSSKINLPLLTDSQSLRVDEFQVTSTQPNRLAVGDTLAALTQQLLGLISDLLNPARQGQSSSSTASNLALQYLEATKNASSQRYDPAQVAALARDGSGALKLPGLGNWTLSVQTSCGPLGLQICTNPVSAWDAFQASVTGGSNGGLVGGLLGGLTDLLGVTACNGLLSNLLNYNGCVRDNLAKVLATRPGGLEGLAGYNPLTDTQVSCGSLLCVVLRPVIDTTLRPLLNGVGGLLDQLSTQVLGIELGRTDVQVQSIRCRPVQLVY